MRVCIAIPHYFKPSDNKNGYGSTRQTARLTRMLSLGRCLGALIGMQRWPRNCLFSMADKAIDHFVIDQDQFKLEPLEIAVTVCTNGLDYLEDVLDEFSNFISIQTFELDDPRQLPIATRDWLLQQDDHGSPYDLYAYLEDDLVINDSEFFDKQLWFLNQSSDQYCLMPHRYEPILRRKVGQLFIDGPLRPKLVQQFSKPQRDAGRGNYKGRGLITFDIPENPHSGLFVINKSQRELLRQKNLPTDGFISPLETAATLTVLEHFTIFKPSIDCSSFLAVEHGHPSFTAFMNEWKHRPLRGSAEAIMGAAANGA